MSQISHIVGVFRRVDGMVVSAVEINGNGPALLLLSLANWDHPYRPSHHDIESRQRFYCKRCTRIAHKVFSLRTKRPRLTSWAACWKPDQLRSANSVYFPFKAGRLRQLTKQVYLAESQWEQRWYNWITQSCCTNHINRFLNLKQQHTTVTCLCQVSLFSFKRLNSDLFKTIEFYPVLDCQKPGLRGFCETNQYTTPTLFPCLHWPFLLDSRLKSSFYSLACTIQNVQTRQ